jgi:hypothetical protein
LPCAASNQKKRHFWSFAHITSGAAEIILPPQINCAGRSFSSESISAIIEQRESANDANKFVSDVRIATPAPRLPRAG